MHPDPFSPSRRLRGTVAAMALAVLATTPTAALTPQVELSTARIDGFFADLAAEDSPGCALGVWQRGDLAYTRGYGSANLDHRIPITDETVFGIGSTSKQFTAAAVVRAVQHGQLSLDDDIRRWLPEFPSYERPITVRHLVHHTSGLRDDAQLRAVGDLPDLDGEGVVALLARQRALNFPPGEQHLYSNSGYVLLAVILERATGHSLRDLAREDLFAPLGMDDTMFKPSNAIVPRRATGYMPAGDGFVVRSRAEHEGIGAGGMVSSVRDFARWIPMLAEDAPDPAFRRAMLERGTLESGEPLDYAFGLDLGVHRGLPAVFHGGAENGYRAGFVLFPTEALAVVTLCNLGTVDAQSRAWQVSEVLLEHRMEPRDTTPAPLYNRMNPPPPGAPRTLTGEGLAELAGQYYAPELDVVFGVRVEGPGLDIGPASRTRLMTPTSEPDVFTDGRGWALARFERDAHGTVTGFTMDIGRVRGLIMERLADEEFRRRR